MYHRWITLIPLVIWLIAAVCIYLPLSPLAPSCYPPQFFPSTFPSMRPCRTTIDHRGCRPTYSLCPLPFSLPRCQGPSHELPAFPYVFIPPLLSTTRPMINAASTTTTLTASATMMPTPRPLIPSPLPSHCTPLPPQDPSWPHHPPVPLCPAANPSISTLPLGYLPQPIASQSAQAQPRWYTL